MCVCHQFDLSCYMLHKWHGSSGEFSQSRPSLALPREVSRWPTVKVGLSLLLPRIR